MHLQTAIVQHPSPVFITAASGLSLFALGPSPSFIPLILLLSTLKVYSTIVISRQHLWSKLFTLVLSLSVTISAAHSPPSLHALSTTATAVATLFLLSFLTSCIALLPIFLDAYISTRVRNPWSQVLLFPALWASAIYSVTYISPVGGLVTWSPVLGLDAYSWMRPITGPIGIDWVVAAYAAVGAKLAGYYIIGAGPEQHPVQPQLISHDLPEEENDLNDEHITRSPPSLKLAIILGLLAIPSYALQTLPLPVNSPTTSSLTVACALPPLLDRNAELEDYVAETGKLVNKAKIVLWPEGAVRFDSADAREHAIARIQSVSQGTYVALGFEEYAVIGNNTRTGMRRNGLMVVTQHDGLVYEYYKRNLVPFVESFSVETSPDPPEILNIALSKKESIPITASICLDFATTAPFAALPSRPALILGPARAWHTSVGMAMWEQAKARTAELDSTVLWCDGGAGGVSGVSGRGISEIVQVGGGSWLREIGIQKPFEGTRTVYGWSGAWPSLVAIWVVTLSSWVDFGEDTFRRLRERGLSIGLPGVHRIAGTVRGLLAWRPRGNQPGVETGERAPLLA